MRLVVTGVVDVHLAADGIRLGLEGLEVHIVDGAEAVRNGSRTSADQAEERGFDSRPPLQLSQRQHRRLHRRVAATADCTWCEQEIWDRRAQVWRRVATTVVGVAESVATSPGDRAQQRGQRGDNVDIDRIDDDRSSIVDSPSDLPLSHAVLLRKYSRGGQRQGHVSQAVLARIRAVSTCPDAGHDDRWCASILDSARGDAVRRLEEVHTQLHAPPPPDPDVQAEALEAERRRQAYVLRQQLEQGVDGVGRPLGDLARQVAERQLMRLEAPQQQGP